MTIELFADAEESAFIIIPTVAIVFKDHTYSAVALDFTWMMLHVGIIFDFNP